MSLESGQRLDDRLAALGKLEPDAAVQILTDVARALAVAHEHDIIHRDVRPGNIIWDDRRSVAILIDFGIATVVAPDSTGERISSTGVVVEVTRYLAPEVLEEEEESSAVDIYALGVTGYELLTGAGPFGKAPPLSELLRGTFEGRAPALSVAGLDPNVAAVVRRCVNRAPHRRPSAADLERALAGRWQIEPLPGWGGLIEAWLSPPPTILGYGFVGASFLAGGTATINEQYPGLLPNWAFTLSLATGLLVFVAAGVLEGCRRTRHPVNRLRVYLGVIAVTWILTVAGIVTLMG